MGVFSGESLEEKVEKFLIKYGETLFDNTEVCVLRRLERLDNQCKGCSSAKGLGKPATTCLEVKHCSSLTTLCSGL